MLPGKDKIKKVLESNTYLKVRAPEELPEAVVSAFCRRFGIEKENIVGLIYTEGLFWNKGNAAFCADRFCSDNLHYLKGLHARTDKPENTIFYDEFLYLNKKSNRFEMIGRAGSCGSFAFEDKNIWGVYCFLNELAQLRADMGLDELVKAAAAGKKVEYNPKDLDYLKRDLLLPRKRFFYTVAALEGDNEALALIARETELGEEGEFHCPKSEKRAAALYYLAAMRGHVPSMRRMGDYCDEGSHGLKKNSEKAMSFYKMAADAGDRESAAIVSARQSSGASASAEKKQGGRQKFASIDELFVYLHGVFGESSVFKINTDGLYKPQAAQPEPLSREIIERILEKKYLRRIITPVREAKGSDVRAVCRLHKIDKKDVVAIAKDGGTLSEDYKTAICTDRIYSWSWWRFGIFHRYQDIFYTEPAVFSDGLTLYTVKGREEEKRAESEFAQTISYFLNVIGWLNIQKPLNEFFKNLAEECGESYEPSVLSQEELLERYCAMEADDRRTVHKACCKLLFNEGEGSELLPMGLYRADNGIPMSGKAILLLYLYGARRGSARAAKEAGECYEYGSCGTEKDLKKAMNFYLRAAELGNVNGARNLAIKLLDNPYYPGEQYAATRLLEEFYESDSTGQSAYILGMNYLNGIGCEANKYEAYNCIQLANALHWEPAGPEFIKLYEELFARMDRLCRKANWAVEDGKYADAYKYAQMAVDAGSMKAYGVFAYLYHMGYGVEKNNSKAMDYARLSEDDDMLTNLVKGDVWYEGLCGLKKDVGGAGIYYRRAGDAGSARGAFMAACIYAGAVGGDVLKKPDVALKYFLIAASESPKNRNTCYLNMDIVITNFGLDMQRVASIMSSLSSERGRSSEVKEDAKEFMTKCNEAFKNGKHFFFSSDEDRFNYLHEENGFAQRGFTRLL